MIRLTQFAKRAGCAAKHPPGYLLPLLAGLPKVTDPRVLVGSSTSDDAAVIRLDDERALVFTTDFFTPIVDDPYEFGAVAAANALSDVWAMGGTPLSALNLVGFPEATLDVSVLGEILRGGADKAKEAGIDIVGGHTIRTEEPIYGLAVTGLVHPGRITSNTNGKPGDVLVLTKPIGGGILTTAAKNDLDAEGGVREAIRMMATLNRGAGEAMAEVQSVRAATDITGFGLLGHLRNITAGSGVSAVIERSKVPVMPHAERYVRELNIAPGGTHANWRFLNEWVSYGEGVDKPAQLLLCDAQTSGGMLIAVPEKDLQRLLRALERHGTPCQAVIGQLEQGTPGKIRVTA